MMVALEYAGDGGNVVAWQLISIVRLKVRWQRALTMELFIWHRQCQSSSSRSSAVGDDKAGRGRRMLAVVESGTYPNLIF